MKITEFLNNNYNDAALYILYRNTASYIDGLKNSSRKIAYLGKKGMIKSSIKVAVLGGKAVDDVEYLHGESINKVIVTMARDFCGSNNLPVLTGIGGFGTRFSRDASAPRYIFVKQPEYFNLLFKKEDDANLELQEFEGYGIEPKFYIPTLPILLLNGTEGVGVGFSSDIHARSIENIIKACRARIEGKKLKDEWFVPSWRGFKGTVEKGVDKDGKDTWIVKGSATFDGKKVLIEEVPITWELQPYLKLLRDLKEKGTIQKYSDFSEDDNFKFEVVLSDIEAKKDREIIMKDLGLVKTAPENLTCFDENNEVRDNYTDIKEIFEDFCKIKLKYMKLRMKSETERLTKEERDLAETYKFIQEVIKGTIVLQNRKKSDVEGELKKKCYTITDKLLGMPLYSITSDKAKEIEQRWKDKIKERKDFEKETPESIWAKDIDELEAELKKEGFIGEPISEKSLKVTEKKTTKIPAKKTTAKKETKNGKSKK